MGQEPVQRGPQTGWSGQEVDGQDLDDHGVGRRGENCLPAVAISPATDDPTDPGRTRGGRGPPTATAELVLESPVSGQIHAPGGQPPPIDR